MTPSPPEQNQPSSGRLLLTGLFVFLWLSFMVGGYIWGHNDFLLPNFWGLVWQKIVGFFTSLSGADGQVLGQTLWNIGMWLVVLWISAGMGRLAVGRFLTNETPQTRLTITTGVGLGVLATALGIVGLLGFINPVILIAVTVLGGIVALPQHRLTWQDVKQLRPPHPSNRSQRLILIYGTISFLFAFIFALSPVVAWDATTYHLVGPKFYLDAGKFVHPVNIPQLGFPLLGQMHFMLGMVLGDDRLPALFHFIYGLLSLTLTVDLARRLFGKEAAWFAGMVLLSVPDFFTFIGWAYVDVTLLFYTTLAVYAFVRWYESVQPTQQTPWLVVMGFACGFAGSLKYTSVAVPIALALSMMWQLRSKGVKEIVRQLGVVAGISALLVLPWLIENWQTTGNPVYPFFFDNAYLWDAWRSWWYDMPGTGYLAHNPLRLLIVPIDVTIFGTQGRLYDATIGPFAFGLLFVLPFVWRYFADNEKKIIQHLLLFFAINYLLWLSGVARTVLLMQARLIIFVFGVTAILGGAILSRIRFLKHPELHVPWLVQTLYHIALIFLLFNATLNFISVNPTPAVIGAESPSAYRTRLTGNYQRTIEAINQLPADAKVVFLWETRSYQCQVLCDPDPILDRLLFLSQNKGYDANQIIEHWQDEGFTHVLIYQQGLIGLLDAGKPIESSLLLSNPIGMAYTKNDLAILQTLADEQLTLLETWKTSQGIEYQLYAIVSQ